MLQPAARTQVADGAPDTEALNRQRQESPMHNLSRLRPFETPSISSGVADVWWWTRRAQLYVNPYKSWDSHELGPFRLQTHSKGGSNQISAIGRHLIQNVRKLLTRPPLSKVIIYPKKCELNVSIC